MCEEDGAATGTRENAKFIDCKAASQTVNVMSKLIELPLIGCFAMNYEFADGFWNVFLQKETDCETLAKNR